MARMTLSAYQAYLAKESARNRVPAPDDAADDEGELHRQIKEYCASKMWLVESGSMAHKTKRRAGECDLTVAMDNGKTAWVECKKKGGKLTPEQAETIHWLKRLGHIAFVCYSLEQFITQINEGKE